MSDEQHTEQDAPRAPLQDLVQRGTDRFHDQQAEARRQARQAGTHH